MAERRCTHRVLSRQLTDAVDRAAVDSLANHVLIIGPAPMKTVTMLLVVRASAIPLTHPSGYIHLWVRLLCALANCSKRPCCNCMTSHHWCVTLALPCSSSTMKVLGAMLVHCAAVQHQQMRLFQLQKQHWHTCAVHSSSPLGTVAEVWQPPVEIADQNWAHPTHSVDSILAIAHHLAADALVLGHKHSARFAVASHPQANRPAVKAAHALQVHSTLHFID